MRAAEQNDLDIDGIMRAGFAPFKSSWLSVLIRVGIPYFLLTLMLWGVLGWLFFQLGAPAFQAIINGEKPDPELVRRLRPLSLVVVLVIIIPAALARTALFRFHAGEGLKGQFLAFRLGAAEVRQYFALWLKFLIVYALPLAVMVGAFYVASKVDTRWIKAILFLSGPILWFVLMVLFGVRFTLIYAQIFSGERMMFSRLWRLTRGHFWVLFLGFGVMMVLYGLVSLLISSPANMLFYAQDASGWLGDPQILKGMDPDDVIALMQTTFLNGKAVIAITLLVLIQFIMDVYRLMMFSGASYYCVQKLENSQL
ncbi:MAG: hypothetical protein COA84_03095 [Robiginitomaculum sp.]|nr:MAG: hypothetical protein COA84_03095 [Robiginitomaculum sp.]